MNHWLRDVLFMGICFVCALQQGCQPDQGSEVSSGILRSPEFVVPST